MTTYYERPYEVKKFSNPVSIVFSVLLCSIFLYAYTFFCRILNASFFDITTANFIFINQIKYILYVLISAKIIKSLIIFYGVYYAADREIAFIILSIIFFIFDTYFLAISHLYIQNEYSLVTLFFKSYPLTFSEVFESLKNALSIKGVIKYTDYKSLSAGYFETGTITNYLALIVKFLYIFFVYIYTATNKLIPYVYSNSQKKYIKAYKKLYFKHLNFTKNFVIRGNRNIEDILNLPKVQKPKKEKKTTYMCILLFDDKTCTLAKVTQISFVKNKLRWVKKEEILMDTFVINNLK